MVEGPHRQSTLRDVVAATQDVMFRKVSVTRSSTSAIHNVRVISFANFNPVFSKNVRAPYQDWCAEERNDEGGSFDDDLQAVVYSRSGIDESTGSPSSVAIGMAFLAPSDAHQLGQDNYATSTPGTSAYDDAQDGELAGSSLAAGQSDAAIADDLDLTATTPGSTTVVIAAAPGGLIVASIATQSPQGLDWIRNGAYVNRALSLAHHPEMVTLHNLAYTRLQATSVEKPTGGEASPPGNWSQNYYANGVVGGPIPYETGEWIAVRRSRR